MKKILAMLLALVMVFALVACGDSGAQQTGEPAPTGSQPSESTPGTTGPVYDNVKLMFSTTYNEAESSGQAIVYFTNYITEKSGGAITFDIKWGGTLAGTGETSYKKSREKMDKGKVF